MRILFVASIYKPVAGGIAVYVSRLAEKLVSMGHSVYILTRHCGGRPSQEVINGVQVFRSGHFSFTSFANLAHDILALGKERNLDLICTGGPKLSWNIASTMASGVLRKPRYLMVMGSRTEQTSRFTKFLSGLLARKVLGISKYCLETYGLWPSRWQLLYPALECLRDEQCSFDDRESLVLTVGWVDHRKRYELVVETAALMPDVRFVVVGDTTMHPGYYRELLVLRKKAKAANLSFVGVLDRRDLTDLYRKAKCFFLPSAHEMFGLVFLEAMCAGTPIISTAVAAVPEVLGYGGVCYPLHTTPDRFAGEIRNLLTDKALWLQRSAAAQTRARDFKWDMRLLANLFPL